MTKIVTKERRLPPTRPRTPREEMARLAAIEDPKQFRLELRLYQLAQSSLADVKHLLRGKHETVLADWDAYDRIEAIRKEFAYTLHAAALRAAEADVGPHHKALADTARTLRRAHQRHRRRWGLPLR